MNGINWGLLGNARASFDNAMARGAELGRIAADARDQRQMREALGRLYVNPDDQEAAAILFQHSPQLAMQVRGYQDSQRFNSALGDYVGGNALAATPGNVPVPLGPQPIGNALATSPSMAAPVPLDAAPIGAPRNGLNQLPPMRQGAGFDEAFAPLSPPSPSGMGENAPQAASQGQQAQSGPDVTAILGTPQNGRDKAFMRMLQIDPERALKVQSTMRDNFVSRLESEADFYRLATDELSAMTDEAGWQRALQRLAPMSDALGANLLDHVPANYPGPEAVQQLLQRALPVKERLDYLLRVANTEADNARADRNTDSLIDSRDRLAGERERHNRVNEGNTRRGQDMTDKRVRTRGSSPRETLPVVSTPAEAAKLPKGTRFKVKGTGQIKVVP